MKRLEAFRAPQLSTVRRRDVMVAATCLATARFVHAAAVTLPQVVSLTDSLDGALRRGEPLLVLVSLKGCPFCEVARNHYLGPLRTQAQIEIVQVDMGSARPVHNFQGQPLTQDQLIRNWRIKVAPTVLFFGRGGVEVAERLVGGSTSDFYGAYLDQRLETARRVVRG